jgi:hypothetical protein
VERRGVMQCRVVGMRTRSYCKNDEVCKQDESSFNLELQRLGDDERSEGRVERRRLTDPAHTPSPAYQTRSHALRTSKEASTKGQNKIRSVEFSVEAECGHGHPPNP